MTSGATPGTAPRAGLRERKKQRTRDALIRSSLELFTAQGYERTTVDEIAEAVDVSQRTFFRYFTNKEDVAFAVEEMAQGYFLEALHCRPATESPLAALRNAVLASWEDIGFKIEEVIPIELYMRAYQMIESTPALMAAHMRRTAVTEEKVARVIAAREGVDIETDPRPRVAVAAFSGVMRAAGRLWGEAGECTVESIRAVTQTHLDHILPALSGTWHDTPTSTGP